MTRIGFAVCSQGCLALATTWKSLRIRIEPAHVILATTADVSIDGLLEREPVAHTRLVLG